MPHGSPPVKFLLIGILSLVGWSFLPFLVGAQMESAPEPLDSYVTDGLNFQEPTGIRGTLRYIERDEQIVWLDWKERSADGPLFQTGWKWIPGGAMLAVHPVSTEQLKSLQLLPLGSALELIIQEKVRGTRQILSYQDRSDASKVPL